MAVWTSTKNFHDDGVVASSPLRRDSRRPAHPAGARLLRRHRFLRRRLSRELSALHGARTHRLSAPARHRPSRACSRQTEQEAPGFAFVVRTMHIEFLKPARMDDVLEIMTAPEEVEGRLDHVAPACDAGWRDTDRGAGARRLRRRRQGAAHSQAAAHRYEGRSGGGRTRSVAGLTATRPPERQWPSQIPQPSGEAPRVQPDALVGPPAASMRGADAPGAERRQPETDRRVQRHRGAAMRWHRRSASCRT